MKRQHQLSSGSRRELGGVMSVKPSSGRKLNSCLASDENDSTVVLKKHVFGSDYQAGLVVHHHHGDAKVGLDTFSIFPVSTL